jgi:hypothetical protein
MDFKKIAGYGVLAVGVLWLLGSSTTGSSVNTGSTGSLLVGGGGLPASPTDSGFVITPPATTNYNFMAQPSDGFIGSYAPADPSTPTSKKSSSSSRVTSSGRSIDTGQTPNTYDVATGTYTDRSGYGYSMGTAPAGSKVIDSKKLTSVPNSYNWATGTYTDSSGLGYSTATPPKNTIFQFGAGWL